MEFTVTVEIPSTLDKIDGLLGPKTTHSGLEWCIRLQYRNNVLGAFMRCNNPLDSNLWSAEVEMEFTIIEPGSGERSISKCTPNCFDKLSGGYGFNNLGWEAFSKEHMGAVCEVECRVKVKKIIGVAQKQMTCFDAPDVGLTDTILMVGERRFYVSKAILGTFSPYFREVLYGKLNDGSGVLVIQNQGANVVKVYLDILYHAQAELTDDNVIDLVKMSERFDTALVMNKCEQFLMSSSKKTIKEKLKISEDFKLAELQNHCFKSLKTREDFKKKLNSSKDLGPLSMRAAYDKLISLE